MVVLIWRCHLTIWKFHYGNKRIFRLIMEIPILRKVVVILKEIPVCGFISYKQQNHFQVLFVCTTSCGQLSVLSRMPYEQCLPHITCSYLAQYSINWGYLLYFKNFLWHSTLNWYFVKKGGSLFIGMSSILLKSPDSCIRVMNKVYFRNCDSLRKHVLHIMNNKNYVN